MIRPFNEGELAEAVTVVTHDGQFSPDEMSTGEALRAVERALGPHLDSRRLDLRNIHATQAVAFGVLVGLEVARQRVQTPRIAE